MKGNVMENWTLQICTNRNVLYTELWNRLIEKDIKIEVFHFSKEELGLPEKGASFDKTYIHSSLTYKNWHRLFFLYKEARTYKELKRYLEGKGSLPNLVHAHTLFSDGYLAYRLNKEFNISYIVAIRSTDYAYFFKYRFYLREFGRNILRNAEKIIFLSPATRDEFFNQYLDEKDRNNLFRKTLIIPNGIDPIFFKNRPDKAHTKPDGNNIKILSVATITPEKNLMACAKASQLLMDEGYSIQYRIAGPIKNQAYAEKLSELSFVTLLGKKTKEDLLDEYAWADIFVLPSHMETFGLVYAEALSQGLAVLYTKGQGFDGQFEEGEVGYHIDDKDPNQIAKMIKLVIQKNYEERSARCIELAKKFDWDRISCKYKDLYLELL